MRRRRTRAPFGQTPATPARPEDALPVTESGRATKRAWWAEALLLAATAGLFGAVSDEWVIAGVAAAIALLPPLVLRRRLPAAAGPVTVAIRPEHLGLAPAPVPGLTLDARIAQLEALRDKLDGCIGCGCLSLDKCALYNPEDRAAAKGDGPRYLLGDSADSVD